jgi:DNA repair protein RadC
MKSSSGGEVSPYVCELSRRKYRGKLPTAIRGPDDVVSIPAIRKLRTAKREHFVALLLNARHELTGVETVSVGSLNASIVHPRLCVAAHNRGYVAAAVMWRTGRSCRSGTDGRLPNTT